MNQQPLVIERTFNASASSIWKAITDKDEMKKWYFDLAAFKPEVGFTFEFYGESEDKKIKYLHKCKVTEVIPERKLTYSWQYDGHPGISFVSFELFPEGEKTKLKLTHEGLETFPALPDFARKSFEAGWTEIIGSNLKNHLS